METQVDERYRSDVAFGQPAAGTLPAESAAINSDPFAGVVQGLASIFLAMPFVVAGAPTMLVIWVLFDAHFRGFNRLDIILVAICGFLGMLIILTAAVFGLIFGISAILAARRQQRPAALGSAGV